MSVTSELQNIDNILKKLTVDDQQQINRILYGTNVKPIQLSEETRKDADSANLEIAAYRFTCNPEQLRTPRMVRIGAFQNKTPLPPITSIVEQRNAFYKLAENALVVASQATVNIFCFQEAWNMPFAFCTKGKEPWCEYAESVVHGPTTKFLQELARQYNMVIISPILERDENHGQIMWNTAVVIDNRGYVLGKHRKNHIPRVRCLNEAAYYMEGNTGHPVFETEFGKIAINICYGRHHPLNWLMFGINGAEIVFNPSATIGEFSEPFWGVEARNAAIANGYFTVAINRVGTEVFPNQFSSGIEKPASFYGSSYAAAPNGSRTPGLSRTKSGLLIAEIDLNLCRQVRDQWGFQMTQRLEFYAKSLSDAIKPDFVPQVIRRQ